jgi:hypothetical protein
MEPLLEDLGSLDLSGIHWVIVGGESGPKARPMRQERVPNIKRQCEEQRSAFFFKQWGGWGADGTKRAKKLNGRLLQGGREMRRPYFKLATWKPRRLCQEILIPSQRWSACCKLCVELSTDLSSVLQMKMKGRGYEQRKYSPKSLESLQHSAR